MLQDDVVSADVTCDAGCLAGLGVMMLAPRRRRLAPAWRLLMRSPACGGGWSRCLAGMQEALGLALALALALALTLGVHAAQAGPAEDLARFETIDALAERANDDAVAQLEAMLAERGVELAPALQRDMLMALRRMHVDGGRYARATAVNRQLEALGRSSGDKNALLAAQLGDIDTLIRQNAMAEVAVQLAKVGAAMTPSTLAAVRWHQQVALGRLYTGTDAYERALEHFIAAVPIADELPRRSVIAKLHLMTLMSRVYINTRNPEKALSTLDEALALAGPQVGSKQLASLHYSRALALIDLNRHAETEQSFERALEISRAGKMAGMEAHILGNMADLQLRQENFPKAEILARLALAKSLEIKDENAARVAKANIGFALGGQGHIEQALPWIDEVIKGFRAAGAQQDLEMMLDEKGRLLERHRMYKEANLILREQQTLRLTQFKAERAHAVAAMQEKFETEQKQRQIEGLKQANALKDADIRNRRLGQMATTLVALLLTVAGGFVWVLYRRAGTSNRLLRDANVQLEFHAVRDPLTGLYNRRFFTEKMAARAHTSDDDQREPPPDPVDCIVLLDVDRFKSVNDTWGHAAGDAVLVEVAARIASVVRNSDLVLRWGGEEFLVFSTGTGGERAPQLVARILAAVGQTPIVWHDGAIAVTISAGFITLPFGGIPEDVLNWEKAIQLADGALYHAKHTGRNRACGVTGLSEPAQAALDACEHDFSAAVSAGLLRLETVIGV